MIPELTQSGYLPAGRYLASVEEVEARFAYNEHRQRLIGQFKMLSSMISASMNSAPSCWMGGSFLSSKDEPADIDLLFIVRRESIGALNLYGRMLFDWVAGNRLKSHLDLDLDTYTLIVDSPTDSEMPLDETPERAYLLNRGYWDNLWSATRSSDILSPMSRGYLEVSPYVE